jgi:hypothetical protein
MTDVGPIPRQLLTRADDFFGDLFSLTLFNKLIRGQMAERAVRPMLMIVEPPGFDDVLGLGHRSELR